MLTVHKKIALPELTGDWKVDGPALMRALTNYHNDLQKPDALAITEATINSSVIGGTSPSAGSFTDVNASGKVDAAGYGQFGNAATIFAKSEAALAANADLDCTLAGSALLFIRNNTDGGVAVVSVELGLGTCTEISDPAAYITVGADPGAASSQFWITVPAASTTIRLRNRYAVAKNVSIAYLMLGGTPA